MDKAKFIEIAPYYYALAVVHYLLEKSLQEATFPQIWNRYNDIEHPEEEPSLPFRPLIDKGVDWLREEGLIAVFDDPFAPKVLVRTSEFVDALNRLAEDTTSPFHIYSKLQNPVPWLFKGLDLLERQRKELNVVASDFEVDEWAPIQIDISEAELQAVITSVDDVVEQVRGDNGYAEHVPQERSFVNDSLSAFSNTLKNAASTSLPYIRKFAFEPLTILSKRFAKTAIEISINAAKEAIKSWLTKHGFGWLDTWF